MCLHIKSSTFVGGTVQSTQQPCLRDVLDKTPMKRDLLELLSEVQDKWFGIGEMLKVDNTNLRSLRNSNHPDDERLADTLQYWIDGVSSPITWGTIVEMLRTNYINLPRVADKIEDKLSTQLYDKYCHSRCNVLIFPGIIIIIAIVTAGTTAEPVLTATAISTTREGKSNVVVMYMSLP